MSTDEKKPRVIEELDDLIKQATEERSHYYVKSIAEKVQISIGKLMAERDEWIANAMSSASKVGILTGELEETVSKHNHLFDENQSLHIKSRALNAKLDTAIAALEQAIPFLCAYESQEWKDVCKLCRDVVKEVRGE